ncbi:hypothetical protein LJC31_06100, partial [Synergistaceae bacterium OttesenSCG-928-I11]|nr:hypothetical protein [Synergistaceae bacterium OttesenSCG-928-I11]
TFQALSYVIDVYRGHGNVQKKPFNVGLYISFFPQLIAGPIVRYETIAEQINERKETMIDFGEGCTRFIKGLSKKVLIADNVALLADSCFGLLSSGEAIPTFDAWLGIIAYTLQIYFDFSGYSDMAIGLGLMFGFRFKENFNTPYLATSITDFWRRWHISLGSWFRDYLYIPLGGNRVTSRSKHIFNLFIVWFLTGLWHGANWTFVIWGLMFFCLLVFEKYTSFTKKQYFQQISHIYTMFFVMMGWVIFRSDSLASARDYLICLFTFQHGLMGANTFLIIRQYFVFIALGLFCIYYSSLHFTPKNQRRFSLIYIFGFIFAFLLSVFSVANSTYSPFIYFNF